jgi:hypothetical protein
VLAAAGVLALILFAIGDFSLPVTMAQLANLADRYVAANAIRRDQFDQEVIIGFFAILLLSPSSAVAALPGPSRTPPTKGTLRCMMTTRCRRANCPGAGTSHAVP